MHDEEEEEERRITILKFSSFHFSASEKSFDSFCSGFLRAAPVPTVLSDIQERLPMYFNLCLDGKLLTCKV